MKYGRLSPVITSFFLKGKAINCWKKCIKKCSNCFTTLPLERAATTGKKCYEKRVFYHRVPLEAIPHI